MKELRIEYYKFSNTSGNYFRATCGGYKGRFKAKGTIIRDGLKFCSDCSNLINYGRTKNKIL